MTETYVTISTVVLQQVERVGIDFTLAVTIWILVFLLSVVIGYNIGMKYSAV